MLSPVDPSSLRGPTAPGAGDHCITPCRGVRPAGAGSRHTQHTRRQFRGGKRDCPTVLVGLAPFPIRLACLTMSVFLLYP